MSESSSIENIKHFSEKILVYIKNQKPYYRTLIMDDTKKIESKLIPNKETLDLFLKKQFQK